VVKRPADALGMTAASLVVTAPFVVALWLILWRPQYGWIATILPLAIALGAPFALAATASLGLRLGRSFATLWTGVMSFYHAHRLLLTASFKARHRQVLRRTRHAPEQAGGESTSDSRSVTIPPRDGALRG
jgi:hypothetical protein